MKILKNAGNFEILNEDQLEQQLRTIESAGRVCYQSEKGPITLESARKFIRMILKRGHESVIEHSSMTVRFSDVSRGFTHELVRHRLCAFSQESTRYVDESDLHFVTPPHKDERGWIQSGRTIPTAAIVNLEQVYRDLIAAGWKRDDARQFLPIGTRAQIVCTANFREWRHIFKTRTGKPAHWEIRRVMGLLLAHVQPLLSPIFDDFKIANQDTNKLDYWGQRP